MSQANLPIPIGTRSSVAPSAAQAPIAAFSDTVALIYEAGIDRGRTGEVLRALERLLDADEIVLGTASSKTHAEFHRSAHKRVLCLDIPGNGSDGARLLVRRHAGRPPFEDSQVILLDLLRPHLQKANWLASLMPHGLLGRLACDTFVSLMNKGLLVCDVDAVIHWCNPVASMILESCEGLTRTDGRLRAHRAFETSGLMTVLRTAVEGERSAMLVSRGPNKHPFGLAAAALHSRHGTNPLVLVAIKEIEREIALLAGRLGELFGLTGAEERLAIQLLNGHTLQSAAAISSKTLATVKSQLHSLLKKTGARGQSELMNVLLSLPSLI